MTSQVPPYLSETGQSERIWQRDAGGELGEIQLALKNYLGETDYRETLLVVALSGGPDSLSLAAGLWRAAQRRVPADNLLVLTVDHEWRAESEAEAQAAAKCAQDLGYTQVKVLRAQVPETGTGPEGSAREMRWRLMTRAAVTHAKTCGLNNVTILTGHTLDDQAETVLLRLGRGASLQTLSAMKEWESLDPVSGLPWRQHPLENYQKHHDDIFVSVARPLLGIRRATTLAACHQAGLVPAFDPTNQLDGSARTATGKPLPRVAIRELVLPELERALGQDPRPALARFADLAQTDENHLRIEAGRVFEKAFQEEATWEYGAPLKLEIAPLESFVGVAVLKRVLHLAGRWAGMRMSDVTSGHLEAMVALICDWHGQGPLDLPGVQVSREGNQLVFRPTGNHDL